MNVDELVSAFDRSERLCMNLKKDLKAAKDETEREQIAKALEIAKETCRAFREALKGEHQ